MKKDALFRGEFEVGDPHQHHHLHHHCLLVIFIIVSIIIFIIGIIIINDCLLHGNQVIKELCTIIPDGDAAKRECDKVIILKMIMIISMMRIIILRIIMIMMRMMRMVILRIIMIIVIIYPSR